MPPVDGIPVLGGFTGDERTEFCVRNHARLRYYAIGWLNRCEVPTARLSAEDVAQEIIAEVFVKWPTIGADPSDPALKRQRQREKYMFTAARRLIWRAAREGKRVAGSVAGTSTGESHSEEAALERALFDAARIPASAGSEQECTVERRDLAEQVDAAMAQAGLSDQQREIVERVWGGEQTRAAAAREMGMSKGQVDSQMNRAKRKLKPALEALGPVVISLLAVLVAIAGAIGAVATVARALENPASLPALVAVLVLVIKAVIRLRNRGERIELPRPKARVSHRHDDGRKAK